MKVHVVIDHKCDEVVGVYEDEKDAQNACDAYEKEKGYRPSIVSDEVCPKCSL